MILQCYVAFIFHRGQLETSVGEEKKYNPRLTRSLEEFVEIMNNLNLAYPKQIGELIHIW